MKKVLSILSVFLLTLTFAFAAEPQNDFSFDESQIDADFDQLNKIESYVQKNGVTLEELEVQNSDLVAGIDLNAEATSSLSSADLPANIPAFWWGCVLTVLGVILVYVLTDNDKEQTKKALMGCLVTAGAYLVFWLVWAVALGRAGYGFF